MPGQGPRLRVYGTVRRGPRKEGGMGGGEPSRSPEEPAPAASGGTALAGSTVTHVVIAARTMWVAVGVVLATLAGLWAIHQARHLVALLIISLFFALALVPGVNYFHDKRGWKRGAAVGAIYLAGLLALLLLTLVLIPQITKFAQLIGHDGTRWLTNLDAWTSDKFGFHIVSTQAAKDSVVTTQ